MHIHVFGMTIFFLRQFESILATQIGQYRRANFSARSLPRIQISMQNLLPVPALYFQCVEPGFNPSKSIKKLFPREASSEGLMFQNPGNASVVSSEMPDRKDIACGHLRAAILGYNILKCRYHRDFIKWYRPIVRSCRPRPTLMGSSKWTN